MQGTYWIHRVDVKTRQAPRWLTAGEAATSGLAENSPRPISRTATPYVWFRAKKATKHVRFYVIYVTKGY